LKGIKLFSVDKYVYNIHLGFGVKTILYTHRNPASFKLRAYEAKGIAWYANRNNLALLISQAGPSVSIDPISYWVASLPANQQEKIIKRNSHLWAEFV
jgi:hypothetical protein